MLKIETYKLDKNDMYAAIKDYMIKQDVIKTPDVIANITFVVGDGGFDVIATANLVHKEVETKE